MQRWLRICLVLSLLILPNVIFCQSEETPIMLTKQGAVTQVDSVGSLLIIFDGSQQVRFTVDQDTKIQRGTDDIMLDDLESDDTVTVQYYKASDGTLKATLITDSNVIASF